jgi:hypothetical protein
VSIKLWTCVRELTGSNLVGKPTIPDINVRGFPQALQENQDQFHPDPYQSTIHDYLLNTFDALYRMQLKHRYKS